MTIIFVLLILSFIGGQVMSVEFTNGIRISALDIMVVVLLFWFILQSGLRVESIKKFIKLYWNFFGLFILVGIISLMSQIGRLEIGQIGVSTLYLFRFVSYASLLPVFIIDKRLNKLGLDGLWWGGVGIAFFGLLQYFLYPDLRNLYYLGWDPHYFRVFSTLLDPNFTGIILVLGLCLSWYMITINKIDKRLIALGSICSFIALLLTYSRGNYMAFIVGAMMLILWSNTSLIRKLGIISLIGVILIGLLIILPRPGGEGVNLLRTLSVFSRIENNQEAWNIFLSSPVVGVGFDTLRYVRSLTAIVEGTESLSHSGAGFHNSILFILATTGILGLLSYIQVFWKLFKKSIKKQQQSSEYKLLIISTTVIFIHSMFDNSLFYPYVMMWLWILAGCIFVHSDVKT
jgi:O-antigen ligase